MSLPDPLVRLIEELQRLPGIGPKGAQRLAFHILKTPRELTDRLADAPWQALGPGRAQRLAELTGPLLGAAFESGLLPAQSTLGIATVPPPSPRP